MTILTSRFVSDSKDSGIEVRLFKLRQSLLNELGREVFSEIYRILLLGRCSTERFIKRENSSGKFSSLFPWKQIQMQ